MDLKNTESNDREVVRCQQYTYVIVHSLYIFEEIFDLVCKCVDTVGGFQLRCETVPYFGLW